MNFREMIKSKGGLIKLNACDGKAVWCLSDMREGVIKAGLIPFIPEELEKLSVRSDIDVDAMELICSIKKLFNGKVIQ